MQVRPVRMKESRAINGAQRPLRQHKPPESPPSSSLALGSHPLRRAASCGDTPLAALPSEGCVGTLLSPLCLRRGVPIIILGQPASDCMLLLGLSAPSTGEAAGASLLSLASLGASRSLHADRPFAPELNQVPPIPGSEDLTGYWIGSPAGIPGERPPLGLEETG